MMPVANARDEGGGESERVRELIDLTIDLNERAIAEEVQ
jgi:hypothetical protein